jgi:hypothetical protein
VIGSAGPLQLLVPRADAAPEALELFIARVLHRGGVWEHPRRSDGIEGWRAVERSPSLLRLGGRIFEIDQSLHTFWLELEAGIGAASVQWRLYFDVVGRPFQRVADALDVLDSAEQADWRLALAGTAKVEGEALVVEAINASVGVAVALPRST